MAGLATALVLGATAAGAQLGGDDSYALVQAVRDKDGAKATDIIRSRGPSAINNRGGAEEAALHLVVRQRDPAWLDFFLASGADPNIAARNGDTPLITAARIGYREGAEELIRAGARVDAANRQGETALILAVQQRQADLVRLLLSNGADPDKTDTAAGYSARDYARRDGRSAEILRLIESVKSNSKAVIGPVLK
jgi:ankyrin repeat protein